MRHTKESADVVLDWALENEAGLRDPIVKFLQYTAYGEKERRPEWLREYEARCWYPVRDSEVLKGNLSDPESAVTSWNKILLWSDRQYYAIVTKRVMADIAWRVYSVCAQIEGYEIPRAIYTARLKNTALENVFAARRALAHELSERCSERVYIDHVSLSMVSTSIRVMIPRPADEIPTDVFYGVAKKLPEYVDQGGVCTRMGKELEITLPHVAQKKPANLVKYLKAVRSAMHLGTHIYPGGKLETAFTLGTETIE